MICDDEVALKFYRLQQQSEGTISLADGEAEPLKGPSDTGTAGGKDQEEKLSSLIERLNERFGTDFTRADQLFFDQVQASAESDEDIVAAARANTFRDFTHFLGTREPGTGNSTVSSLIAWRRRDLQEGDGGQGVSRGRVQPHRPGSVQPDPWKPEARRAAMKVYPFTCLHRACQ